jgi:hypothetical protein
MMTNEYNGILTIKTKVYAEIYQNSSEHYIQKTKYKRKIWEFITKKSPCLDEATKFSKEHTQPLPFLILPLCPHSLCFGYTCFPAIS